MEVGGKMVLRCCDGKVLQCCSFAVLQSSSTRVQRWRLEGRGEGIEVLGWRSEAVLLDFSSRLCSWTTVFSTKLRKLRKVCLDKEDALS